MSLEGLKCDWALFEVDLIGFKYFLKELEEIAAK
jgi:hypothetical protein